MTTEKKILLVDDDAIYLFIAQKTLKNQFPNAAITICKNGEEALKKLNDFNPDVMLLDINMPILNGWGLLEKLQKKNKELQYPIFIVSSSIDENDKQKAASHTFVKGYIEKPIDQNKLAELEKFTFC